MKKWILSIFVCLGTAYAQVPVAPIVQPRVFFVDDKGKECSGCKLYTYAAGSSTPQATYVDSSGTGQNTNPIVLDSSGGAQIWFGRHSYKLILKTSGGTTLWTVDNVNASNGFPCGPSHTIQIANTSVTGFTCDSVITIDPVSHTINVGTLPTNYVTIGAKGTPTKWDLDTTSAATARTSLGTGQTLTGTTGQVAVYPGNGTTVQGATALPNGITATTQTADDNSTKVATTAYVKAPGAINPTGIAVNGGTAMTGNQGTGTLVQHSTGTPTADNCAKFDANGNTADAGFPCSPPVAHTIQAVYRGSSCTMGDDGTGGSGCIWEESWGSTISGIYNVICQPDYDSLASCKNIGNCSALILNMVSHTSTTFTYYVNTRVNTSRTHTIEMTCMAIN